MRDRLRNLDVRLRRGNDALDRFEHRVAPFRRGVVSVLLPVIFITIGILSIASNWANDMLVSVFWGIVFIAPGFYFVYRVVKHRQELKYLLRGQWPRKGGSSRGGEAPSTKSPPPLLVRRGGLRG